MLRAVRALAPRASPSAVRLVFPVSTTIYRVHAGYHTTVVTHLPPLNPVAMYQHLNSATHDMKGLQGRNISALKDIATKEDNSFDMGEMTASLNVVDSPISWTPFPLVVNAPSLVSDVVEWEALNRNARRPKRANHGKRPCSHVRRRSKRLK